MIRNVTNLVAFNVAWFACVLGSVRGLTWLGPAVALAVVIIHLSSIKHRSAEFVVILGLTLIGVILDTVLMNFGILRFASGGHLIPLWFAALWPSFATLLNVSLKWLQGRWFLAIAFGLIGGPLAYYSGARLGALSLHPNLPLAVIVIGVEWALVTPLALWLAGCVGSQSRAGDGSPVSVESSHEISTSVLEGGD